MRACKHSLLELSTAGQGRMKYVTTLQTRACPLEFTIFLSKTWHRALPELLNKHATCNKTLTEHFRLTPKLPKWFTKPLPGPGGQVVYRLVSIKWYVLHFVTTKPSPRHIAAKNGHLLLTVQTLAVGEMLQITGKGLLYGNGKLKRSALAL